MRVTLAQHAGGGQRPERGVNAVRENLLARRLFLARRSGFVSSEMLILLGIFGERAGARTLDLLIKSWTQGHSAGVG
ncbi:MAG: hypothetical protein ABJP67_14520 [Nitratireductor sp.]